MTGQVLEIPQRVAAELTATIPPQLPARSEELRADPNAVRDLIVRRMGELAAERCPQAPQELTVGNINPDDLSLLEHAIVGGVVVTEWRKGLVEGEGVAARFRPRLIGNSVDDYVHDDEPTYGDYFLGAQRDINEALHMEAGRIGRLANGHWLRPFIDRFDQLLAHNHYSTATDTFTALTSSSLTDTTFDLIELIHASPLRIPTDNVAGFAERSLSPEEKEQAAHDLVALIGARASMRLQTFFRARRLTVLEGYLERRPTKEDREMYVFRQTNGWGEVFPHTNEGDVASGSSLRVRCIAHQHVKSDGAETAHQETNLELLAHAIINLAGERKLFSGGATPQTPLREL